VVDRVLTPRRRLGALPAALRPWWVQVLVVFAASRVVTTALMLWAADAQAATSRAAASPGYLDFASQWDGQWYWLIALSGYPAELPLGPEGHVGENAWAFMPGYPVVVRLLMELTGAPFGVVGVAVSVAFAAATSLVLYRLFVRMMPHATALFAVVLFCVAPLSPLLQIAYAESMNAFLLALALLLLVDRRYLLLVPVVTVMALTRPSGLAFALALLLHLVWRWWRRADEPFPPRQIAAVIALGLFTAVLGFGWLLTAGLVTGVPTAYLDTELAWRAGYVGYGELVPFAGWIEGALWWAGFWDVPPALLLVLLVLVVVAFGVLLASRSARRLAPELRFWSASYALYLLAVFFPQSSTVRLLMPLFPLVGALAQPRSRLYRVVLVAAGILGQWLWLRWFWQITANDWTPP